jgi:hypothetical protein
LGEKNNSSMQGQLRSLEEQRKEFAGRKLLATPIAGLIVWFLIGLTGLTLSTVAAVWAIFIGTGSVVYLGMFISRFTGENFLDRSKPKNEFDALFFYGTFQAILVYSIAIPFFLVDYSSLPLTVGILTGLMWLPISWIIQHWVGIFHAVLRTATVLALWYLFPDHRFVAIPFAIVLIYVSSIVILRGRVAE